MAVQWLSSLPTVPLTSGLNGTPQDQVLRSSMDAGPGKERRKFTAGVMFHNWTFRMSTQQLLNFIEWYDTELHGGALRFELMHYLKKELKEFKYVKPYSYTPRGGDFWNVTMPIKEMP